MSDIIVRNGKVVEHDGVYEHDLYIHGGKVVAAGKLPIFDGAEVIDAEGRLGCSRIRVRCARARTRIW